MDDRELRALRALRAAGAADKRARCDPLALLIEKNRKEQNRKEILEKERAKKAEILEKERAKKEREESARTNVSARTAPFSGKSRTLGSMTQIARPTLKLNTSSPMKHTVEETALILKMVETILESEVSSEDFQIAKLCFLGLLENDDDHQILLKECYATIRAKLDSEDPQFSEDLQCSELQEAFRRSKIDF